MKIRLRQKEIEKIILNYFKTKNIEFKDYLFYGEFEGNTIEE